MDKHFISDSLLFDIWCWKEATPAILKRAVQQLANAGVNYTTIEADCWYGERPPAMNLELQTTPFLVTDGKWDLSKPNPEWDARLREFVILCSANGITVQLQLFTQQYDKWRDYMPWSNNVNGVNGLWPNGHGAYLSYVRRAIAACANIDVRFSAGCELSGNPDDVAAFHFFVLGELFTAGIPLESMLLGLDFASTFVKPADFSGEVEQIKGKFDALWMPIYGAYGKDTTAYFIRKYAHGVHRLNVNGALDIGIGYHAPYATQWEFSTDGDWGGDSPVDRIEHYGRVDVKPSYSQMFALSGKLFDAFNRPIVIDVFHEGQFDGATGRPVMDRLINCLLLGNTQGVVDAYEQRFGRLANHGAVVDPYVEPVTPVPPTPKPAKPKLTWQGIVGLAVIAVAVVVFLILIL
jgi:hypothetical protein